MEGRFLTINPAACKIFGYSEEELLGMKMDSLIPEKYKLQFTENYLKQITSEGKAEGIMSILNKNGKTIYLLYHNYLANEPGSESYVIGFAQNITERIFAEEALKRSEEKYRGIIENMNLGMIEIDPNERIIFANQRFCTMSGYNLEELVTKKATDMFLRGESLKKTRTQLSKRRYGITNSYEMSIRTKGGEEKWWLTSAAPVFGAGEQVKGTIGIHLDITNQKKLEEQLREAKQNADALTRSKDIFLTNMSHEIRTPLNAIMGLGKLLGKDQLNVKQKNYLAGIESASSSLLAITNDLLDFSKLEAGKISIESISFSLNVIAAQAVSILTHKAEEKGLDLTFDIDKKIAPVLCGDPYRINQVFMNLLSNSIKFTEKGSISLNAFLLGEADGFQDIRIDIQDTGVGIKPGYLENLFDKFTQEDETVVRKFGGTGLGMSITQQLMELMGGKISVESEKNVGTTIHLTFRLKVGSSKILEKKRTIKNDTSQLNNRRVLLVEDNSLNRLLAYTILTEYGAIVTEAENGAEAVALMREEAFDIILMDIQMPVMDGIKATQIIRSEINKTIPIIALTANAIKGKEDQFLDGGMNDYIVKPYSELNLVTPVAKWLSKITATAVNPKAENNKETDTDNDHATPENTATKEPMNTNITEQAMDDEVKEASLYDLEKLLTIARNDTTFITKMLQLFVSETGQGLIKLKEAYGLDDLKTVKYYAHRMKPSISNLGIDSIKKEVVDIEFMEARTPETDMKLEKLTKTLELVIAAMKADYAL
jgi:PAS domain S-box-containing protein